MEPVPLTAVDPCLTDLIEKITELMREKDVGGVILLADQKNGAMALVSPKTWYPDDMRVVTVDEKRLFLHFMRAMQGLSATVHDMACSMLNRAVGFWNSPPTKDVWH